MKKQLIYALVLSCSLGSGMALAASLAKGTRAFEKQDYETALAELKPLAQDGDPEALNMLGQMYEHGWGVEQNEKTAKRYYLRGVSQGHLGSVNSLRALKNKAYVVEFAKIEPDAENGNASAQNRLGEMYEFGYGTNRNADMAYSWYRKAAEQDYLPALHNLGRCYNFGTGVEQNFEQAEIWYRKAAERGHTDAMFFLGTLYSNHHGSHSEQDSDIQAYAWMHNAAELGNQTAKAIERRLIMKLDPQQQESATALSEEYRQQYVLPYK
ncbi:tetratricopeptide repeat protein [Neptuniibacter sp. CAU 1671]|uniref:tetratricopeptide repeat protein n=1 Tax=Neptuniibacter sp. CAU 1671 TaxID=3032593 RepID=UPI0023D97BF1|nr:tetratricopeptide repeat protein [Neptuniibacter sp. CAU 1671]MDF2181889.1 tetratricopeptide repeat protein [Neptuniibacter sp. CAU 1671]